MDNLECLPKTRLASLALISTLLFLPNAHAALLDQWGTFTQTSTFVCGSDPCNTQTDVTIGPTDHGLLATFSDITFSNGTFGSAEAHANLSAQPGLNMPNLRAQAAANADVGTLAIARGAAAYTYLGATPKRLDLSIILTGSENNPNNSSLNRVIADIYVMDADAAEATYPLSAGGVLLQSRLATPFQSSIGIGSVGINAGAISFDVNPGDSFYLLASLITQAADTGTAISLNSLTMSFVDDADLIAASSTVVPLPAPVWLFGFGLVVLMRLACKKPVQRTG